MIFALLEEADGTVLELDEEGIEYLERGLDALRAAEPGEEFSAPSLVSDGDEPVGVGELVLRRA